MSRPPRFFKSIEHNRDKKNKYHSALINAQQSNEIASWIHYFVVTVLNTQREAEIQIDFILRKTKFFDKFNELLSERHVNVIRRMLEEGPQGFEGRMSAMSAKKNSSITGISKATATLDLQLLTETGALKQTGGRRSTRYEVNL